MIKKIIFFSLVLLSFLQLAFSDFVKEIRVVDINNKIINNGQILSYSKVSEGDEVKSKSMLIKKITKDTDLISKSGIFSYVNSSLIEDKDGFIVVYKIKPKYRLRKLIINGAEKISNKKIKEKSNLVLGSYVDEVDFENSVLNIQKAYKEYWYPYTDVTWKSKSNSDLGIVDLSLNIVEGKKLSIKKIDFKGNYLVESKLLKKIISQKERNFLSFITDSGMFDPESTNSDIERIKSFYLNKGFLDVQVSLLEIDEKNPLSTKLTFLIDEGRHYKIRSYKIDGVKSFEIEELKKRINLVSGDEASKYKIDSVLEAIRAFYGNRGYINTNVKTVFDTDPSSGEIDITYSLNEGKKSTISDVIITGNKRTLDHVIRREVVVIPGEEFNRSRLIATKNRLLNLNYFKKVDVSPKPSKVENFHDIIIDLEEKPTGQFNAGVGMSSMDSLIGYVDISQGNFKYNTWPPIGGGQKFQVRIQAGSYRNDLEFSFSEPWFMDRKLSFGINAYHRESRYFSEVYDQINDGLRLSLGEPLSRDLRHSISYKIEQYQVKNADSAPQFIQDEEAQGKRLSSGAEYLLTFDTRNKSFGATRGNKTIVSPYVNGGIFGGDIDLYGLKLRTTHFTPLIWDMVFVSRLQIESVDSYNDMNSIPIFDKLFLGGTYSLRGYDFRDIGPREINSLTGQITSNESIGGLTSAFASTELTFPLWNKVRGALFYDWGIVNEESWDFNTDLFNDNVGIGLRLELPGFPLQLDYGWPINFNKEERGESGKPKFNFLMGYSY